VKANPRLAQPAARILERRARFGASLLWQLQRRFFDERGVGAWRDGVVPHYITSNPTIANAYAEIVFAFHRDLERLEPGAGPLTICELGAGSGRFAFHFLQRLAELCDEAGVAPDAFRYVLTDVVQANLDILRLHPCFGPFFASGLLDLARFDVLESRDLELQVNGRAIAAASLERPLVAIANYVFDGIPQDLIHFADGRAAECLVSLSADADPAGLDAAGLLGRIDLEYDEAPLAEAPYSEPELRRLFDRYRAKLDDSYLLFPAPALRGLKRLTALSRQGLLLLTADKGEHRIEALDGQDAPGPARHGSISLAVNYDAFVQLCELGGGLALLPSRPHRHLDVVALLSVPGAERYATTRRAYRRHVRQFGPDDFYLVARHAWDTMAEMSAETIFAFLRLSHHDSHQFLHCVPRLLALASEMDEAARGELREAVDAVWALHFPLGEESDLAHDIAALLYAIDDYPGALTFYERSIAIYGCDSGTLFNIACCHHLLGRPAEAAAALRDVLRHDPGNHPAAELLEQCEAAALIHH
jgi:tetratricopeptide (TPR) repeat protein